jgi:phage regulator Rha-like protein
MHDYNKIPRLIVMLNSNAIEVVDIRRKHLLRLIIYILCSGVSFSFFLYFLFFKINVPVFQNVHITKLLSLQERST